jgi:hypothetical protein
MKVVWTIVALLLLGGLIVLFQPEQDARRDALSAPDASATESGSPAAAPAPAPREPAKGFTPPPPSPGSASTAAATGARTQSTVQSASATASPPAGTAGAGVKKQPSAEPPPPPPEAVASGAAFEPEIPTIPEAEILPSKFIRLADGSISVDDAWTIRGAGTDESPYEVSWEFLSSAQEEYMPRLGEKKLPARIAFLSGKRVRISGYLAFPLVAPTASECLLMLNQWDGCCIGIPPTPYDAVEVKLMAEIKGWKRHTINFGAIEGTFKVEPYLVENWLVGLYLIEGAKLDTEL